MAATTACVCVRIYKEKDKIQCTDETKKQKTNMDSDGRRKRRKKKNFSNSDDVRFDFASKKNLFFQKKKKRENIE